MNATMGKVQQFVKAVEFFIIRRREDHNEYHVDQYLNGRIADNLFVAQERKVKVDPKTFPFQVLRTPDPGTQSTDSAYQTADC